MSPSSPKCRISVTIDADTASELVTPGSIREICGGAWPCALINRGYASGIWYELLDAIDQFTDNRSAAMEKALRLWRIQKIENQLRQYYLHRSQTDIQEKERWAALAEQQLDETLEAEGL